MGEVTYTVQEMVYKDGIIYGVATVHSNTNIILIPEDIEITDPAGFSIFDREAVPEGTKSYAELAQERSAKSILTMLRPNTVVIDGQNSNEEVGYFCVWAWIKPSSIPLKYMPGTAMKKAFPKLPAIKLTSTPPIGKCPKMAYGCGRSQKTLGCIKAGW
jgi:hypothetical protein